MTTESYPKRKLQRASFHDYNGGYYFVTFCTYNHVCCLGKISDSRITYTKLGLKLNEIIDEYIENEIVQFVIMPNHVHLIVNINNNPFGNTTARDVMPLSRFIGRIKKRLTMFAKNNNIDFHWQKSFHDRIIRNNKEADLISRYISGNVANWDNDCFYI